MTSSDMHFGPSWMQNASRSTTKRSQNHQPAVAASPAAAAAEPTHPSYSSIALPPAPPSNANGSSLGYENASKPFKYSKEYMLGMWDDAVQRERELPIEFERWDVVFREETDGPVGLKPLSEAEKKAFALPFNPDRRANIDSLSREPSLRGTDRRTRGPVGGIDVSERGVRGERPLNSPARERFGGIQGGVLGGLGGTRDGAGGLGRGDRTRRTGGKDGELDPASIAPLPPSSTSSWRPTRQLSSNTLPLDNPSSPSVADAELSGGTPRSRWREAAPIGRERSDRGDLRSPAISHAAAGSAFDDEEGGAGGGGGGGFGGAKSGGWRERERMRAADRDVGAAAGWENVKSQRERSSAGYSRSNYAENAAILNGRTSALGNSTSGQQQQANGNPANAFAALENEDADSQQQQQQQAPQPEVQAAPIVDHAAELAKTQAALKEELAKVNWFYKDPSDNIQGPFGAQSMQDWHNQGYFTESLQVRRENDTAYETVGTLTKLAVDKDLIFFQPAPGTVRAPPGLASHDTISRVSTPGAGVASPLQAWASGVAAALPDYGGGANVGGNDLNGGGAIGSNRWGLGTEAMASPQQQQAIPQQYAQQYAQQPQQQAFDQSPLAYAQQPRHNLGYNSPLLSRQAVVSSAAATGGSPYASPVVQHAAPSPWTQSPQANRTTGASYYENGQMSSPRVGYQYSPVSLAPGGGGWGANDWRGGSVAQQQQPQQPQQYQQQPQHIQQQNPLIPSSVQQHQHQSIPQQSPWGNAISSPSISSPQPVVQNQQQEIGQPQQQHIEQQAVEQQPSALAPAPASRWAQPLSHASPAQSPAVPAPVQQQQQQIETSVEAPAQAPTPVALPPNASVPPTPLKAVPASEVAPSPAPTPVSATSSTKASKPKVEAVSPLFGEEPVASPPIAKAGSPAPWGTPSTEKKEPAAGPSLREIQEAEAKKVAAANKKKQQAAAQAQAQAGAAVPSSTDNSAEVGTTTSWGLASSGAGKPATPSTASTPVLPSAPAPPVWQTGGGAAPSRTLKQIQEEEQKQKARAKAAQLAAMGGNVPVKGAYSGAAANGSPAQSNANAGVWATVGASGKASAPAPKAATPKPAAPVAVKPAAAVQPLQTAAQKLSKANASLDEISPSTDFLSWAKTSLKSVTGVNIDEFLQMLLTFPVNPDPTVMEIISDSVYAHSSTLDGRRFAQEFCTKRKADAKAQKSGGVVSGGSNGGGRANSLADIVKAQPKAAADSGFGGWGVVVKGKKGKKN